MAEVFGIDVSKWQKGFDFTRAAAKGVRFAVIRGAYSSPDVISGGGTDTEFENHFTNACSAGLDIGVYQYSMAKCELEAEREAEYLIKNCLAGKNLSLPVFIDVEDSSLLSAGKRRLTDAVKAWCNHMENHGFFAGIYASKSFFDDNLFDAELTQYTHWVAQWDTKCTYTPVSSLGMWQFGGETNRIRDNNVCGVVCDQNYMLVDYPSFIKKKGLNGFGQKKSSFSGECSGTNIHREKDSLVQYIAVPTTNTNRYGYEVPVDKNGVVTANPVYGIGNMCVPEGGRVLSGHGTAGEWMHENIRCGYTLYVDSHVHVFPGVRRSLDGINEKRSQNSLVMYRAPLSEADTNEYGSEVAVSAEGVVLADPVYGKGKMAIPAGGYVISGHGKSSDWVQSFLHAGRRVSIENDKIVSAK